MPDLDIGGEPFPKGTITMWSGLLSNIPLGWFICDGTLGTPDLIALFTRGAPPATEPLTELGADQHTITVAEMPSHDHDTSGLGHSHEMSINSVPSNGSGTTGLAGNTGSGVYQFRTTSAESFSFEGSNGAHENKPPFFELAYIQRVN